MKTLTDSQTRSIARKVVVGVAAIVLVPVVATAALALSARGNDGPSVLFPGGALVAGEWVTEEPDWSFVRDVGTIELQLLDPERSRLVWIAESEGKVYVVSGYMGSTIGRLWKRWPLQAERDGKAVIRVGDRRFPRTLIRMHSGPAVDGIVQELRRKYGFGATAADIAAGGVWLFELAPADWDTGASM